MATNNKKKKAVAAVAAAAVLLLGGTFAWQSISQTALNEASDVINPGGRLHDDFYIDNNGDYNSDIYVENFADDDIFARVKLSEYMEVVVNKGVEGAEKVETIVGSKSLKDGKTADSEATTANLYDYSYVTHYFDQENATDEFWAWTAGDADSAQVYYMPTFNKNKDSLVADRNGMYVDRIGGISNRSQDQYEDWTVWGDGDSKEGIEIYDADSDQDDEVKYDFDNLSTHEADGAIKTVAETHTAALVGETKGLISMDEWLALGEDADKSDYWVYDTDGWVYWTSPIAKGETTGLLLDSIELKKVMDDTWYYAIEAEAQFVTKDDLGQADGTGFYDTKNGLTVPSDKAEELLKQIGVTVELEAEEEYNGPLYTIKDNNYGTVYAKDIKAGTTFDVYSDSYGFYLYSSDSSTTWSSSGHSESASIWNGTFWMNDEDIGTVIELTHTASDGNTYTIYANIVEPPARLVFGNSRYYETTENRRECYQDDSYDYYVEGFANDVTLTLYNETGEVVPNAIEGNYVNLPAGYNTSYVLTATDGITTISVDIDILDEYKLYLNNQPVGYGAECIERGDSRTFSVFKNDELNNNLAEELEWTLETPSSTKTKVEAGVLTIGEDETKGDIYLYVNGEHEGDSIYLSKKIHPISGVLDPVINETYNTLAEINVLRADGKYVVTTEALGFETPEYVSAERHPNNLNGLTYTVEKYKGKNALVIHVDGDNLGSSQNGEFTFTQPQSNITLRVNFTE